MAVPTSDVSDDHARRRERFRALYDQLYDDLWRYCRRRSPDDEAAGDVLADVMLVAWERLDDIPPGARARPWLFGVARNQLRSRWRNKKRLVKLTDRLIGELAVRPEGDPAADGLQDFDHQALAQALGDLKERDRELLLLATWDELPYSEIAEIFNCSENAVAIRLHRARQRLATHLERRQ